MPPPTLHRSESLIATQQYILMKGYTPVLYFSHALPLDQLNAFVLKIIARRPVGLLVIGNSISKKLVTLIQDMGLENIVLLSTIPLDCAQTILLPARSAGFLASHHLLEKGHRCLGIIWPDDPAHHEGNAERLAGMQDALADFPGSTLDIFSLLPNQVGVQNLVDIHLSHLGRPTGIYAFNDEYAILLLGALSDRGIRVPQDIAVVGTDDISIGTLVRPTLTTIRFDTIPPEQRAVEIVIARQKGLPLSSKLTAPLEPVLIPRNSTDLFWYEWCK